MMLVEASGNGDKILPAPKIEKMSSGGSNVVKLLCEIKCDPTNAITSGGELFLQRVQTSACEPE